MHPSRCYSPCLVSQKSPVITTSTACNVFNACNCANSRTAPPPGVIVVDSMGAYKGSFLTLAEGVANLSNTPEG
ncbi:hypothetical protein GQ600_2405 [Phytophthora cactorum]|nr:hypothetical protein GQ600_2405 [Phytophthora cactorum]